MNVIDNVLYADEGKLLDYLVPNYEIGEDGNPYQIHYYQTSVILNYPTDINNWIEVEKDKKGEEI